MSKTANAWSGMIGPSNSTEEETEERSSPTILLEETRAVGPDSSDPNDAVEVVVERVLEVEELEEGAG